MTVGFSGTQISTMAGWKLTSDVTIDIWMN